MYKAVTSPVPAARESGTLRRGFFTSPAVKVMLFQASDEKSEPTWATQKAMNNPNAPPVAATVGIKDKSGLMGETPVGVHRSEKLAFRASAFRPTKKPTKMSATKESVFAEVKTFWMSFPIWSPRVLMKVSNTMITIATNCCVERLTAYLSDKLMGGMSQDVGETPGASTPRYREKATATAAMVPV